LNLNILATKQNIKNLDFDFEAIYVRTMHVNFQASSFTGVGGEWSDIRTCDITPCPYTKFLNSPLALVFQLYCLSSDVRSCILSHEIISISQGALSPHLSFSSEIQTVSLVCSLTSRLGCWTSPFSSWLTIPLIQSWWLVYCMTFHTIGTDQDCCHS